MGYLKTVLTYDRPSEAEVDKSFLESRGIAVCLLNGETTRNELGAPFYIQLQVNEGDFTAAWNALRETNPTRFGSPFRVEEIDRAVKRSAWFFFVAGIPAGLVAYWLIPSVYGGSMLPSARAWPVLRHGPISPDLRVVAALVIAILAGIISATLATKKPRRADPVG
jgi:hypothetical protein